MGKLKEKLLNNLTPEEMDYIYGPSAFEYVELMEKYKQYKQLSLFDDNGDVIPEDVLEQMLREKEIEEQQFYEQEHINQLNESNKLKYTDSDILYVLDGIAGPTLKGIIMGKLNDVWNTKNGFFE